MEENKEDVKVEETKEVLEQMKQEETVQNNNTYSSSTEKKLSVCGLVSFIFSLIGIWAYGLPLGIAAIILGIIGIVTFKKETQKGRGFAIAGLCVGAFDAIMVILAIIAVAAYLY